METKALHILLVEDSEPDAELIRRALRDAGGLRLVRVADEASLRGELQETTPDIVLSDFSMPGFSGREALRIVREVAPDLPFIFVSGTIGEELAIDALRRGASDYVLKDNLLRLPAAVERAIATARERHARRAAEHALRESEERFRAIVEHSDDWIWEMGVDGRLLYSNPSVERILGWSVDEMLERDVAEFIAPQDREALEAGVRDAIARKAGWGGWLLVWRHRDGGERTLESNGQPIFDEHGALAGFRGVDRDVTERIAQASRIGQLARIQGVLGAVSNAVLHARDEAELMAMTCRVAVREGDYLAAALVDGDDGRPRVVAEDGTPALNAMVGESLATGDPARSVSLRALRAGGEIVVTDASDEDAMGRRLREHGVCAKIALPLGSPPWGVLVLHSDDRGAFEGEEIALLRRLAADIDHGREFLRKSDRLEFLAYHNTLTGLPNRTALATRLVERLARGPQTVALLDVVNFHVFNDSRGREFSDALLRAIADTLVAQFGTGGLVAHPGDDSFALAFDSGPDADADHGRMTQFLEDTSRRPFTVNGQHVYADLRCGLLHAPRDGGTPEAIDRNVMSALSEARNTGARLVVYDEALSARAQKRVDIEHELRVAVEKIQFELFLQPKFNARSQSLVGAEALLRWRHPERGLISPAEFIPLLEETGMILPVGRWILQQAIAICARWRRRGHDGLRLAINLSARELADEGFLRDSTVLLRDAGPDHGIDVELTESLVMDDIGRSIRLLQSLRDVGCGVAIDDYGTGYSSLNYLSRLPCDTLKIDRTFVADISQSPESLSLVTNTIGLAHSLGLRVVAEGVEEEEQAKLLRLLRCDEVQGYLFGRPVPVAEFDRQFID